MVRYAQRSLCCSGIFNLLSSSVTAQRLQHISPIEWLGIEEITSHSTNVCLMNAWKVSVAALWPCDHSLFIYVSWYEVRAAIRAVNPFYCTAVTIWNVTILHHVYLHHAPASYPLLWLTYSQLNSVAYKLLAVRNLVTVSRHITGYQFTMQHTSMQKYLVIQIFLKVCKYCLIVKQ